MSGRLSSMPASSAAASRAATAPAIRGLHSFNFQLNVSAFCG